MPFNAAGPDNAPMAEVIAACHAVGVWPVTHYNRLHLTPPLVISDDDARLGIDRLDAALTVADAYSTD